MLSSSQYKLGLISDILCTYWFKYVVSCIVVLCYLKVSRGIVFRTSEAYVKTTTKYALRTSNPEFPFSVADMGSPVPYRKLI